MIDRIRLDRWTVTSGSNVVSRAAVVLNAGSHGWQASAEGTGAVDALFRAVDTALRDVLGGSPVLLRYDVHALSEGPDAEGGVTVRIAPPAGSEGARSDGRFSGEAASVNTIAASLEAYIEALNAMLASEAWTGAARAAGDARGDARTDAETEPTSTEFDAQADVDAMEWFSR